MDYKKVLEKFEQVKVSDWDIVLKIVENHKKVLYKEWEDTFKQNHPNIYPLDTDNIKIYSTYSNCVDAYFSYDKNKLICELYIYDGDNMTGVRENLRFCVKYEMDDSFINFITGDILSTLRYEASKAYDEYLDTKREKWINNFMENFI